LQSLSKQAQSILFTVNGDTLVAANAGTYEIAAIDRVNPNSWLPASIVDQKFRILGLLGEGGMGAVYKAHHEFLKKNIALKTFKTANYTQLAWKQFQNEAKILARLNHPQIISIYDFGFAEGQIPYFTMELLNGESLDEKLKNDGTPAVEVTLDIFIQVCQGLTAAHKKGILHRDIKPANIFLENQARGNTAEKYNVKLLDFGIAELAAAKENADSVNAGTGTCFGSPLYMSPEQATCGTLTPASDIYSCGCALFEALTGKPPFYGATIFDTLLKHQTETPPALTQVLDGQPIPERLERLLAKMLAKRPEQRFNSIADVEKELKAILQISLPSIQRDGTNRQPSAHSNKFAPSQTFIGRNAWASLTAMVLTLFGAVGYFLILAPLTAKVNTSRMPAPIPIKLGMEVSPSSVAQQKEKLAANDAPTKFLVKTEKTNSGTNLYFKFPEKNAIGIISKQDSADSTIKVPAVGDVQLFLRPGEKLRLKAFGEMQLHPDLFRGFGADDLSALELVDLCPGGYDTGINWTDTDFDYISHLTGIEMLQTNNSSLTGKSLASLNKLGKLEVLILNGMSSDCAWLANLKVLPQLRKFTLSDATDTKPILEKLAADCRLIELNLKNCSIGAEEIEQIVKLRSVYLLALPENPSVTNLSIEKMAAMPKLSDLDIHRTGITPAAINSLAKIKKLALLHTTQGFFTEAQKKELSTKLGHNLDVREENRHQRVSR
jgi:serine/threonine protein kinase